MTDQPHTNATASARNIVIGKNSTLWRSLQTDPRIRAAIGDAIGHRDIPSFSFRHDDRVWILSYARNSDENEALIDSLKAAGIRQVVYVSTATTNILETTSCYEYPRVKNAAALYARHELNATVILLGYVYGHGVDLPAGRCAAVSLDALTDFIAAPPSMAGGETIRLFEMVITPFRSPLEKALHGLYDRVQHLTGRFPCILRPVDLVVRAVGYRWYGYFNLSNRLWSSTIS